VMQQTAEAQMFIRRGSLGAVAYAPSSGRLYFAYNHNSRWAAEQDALRRSYEHDAQLIAWVDTGYVAVAVADNRAWGFGVSYGSWASRSAAIDRAMHECRMRGPGARLALVMSSDGRYLWTR